MRRSTNRCWSRRGPSARGLHSPSMAPHARDSTVASTFPIVAADPATGEVGVAVQSKYLAVGAVVPWVRAGVGAVATQAMAFAGFGPQILERQSGDLLRPGLLRESGRAAGGVPRPPGARPRTVAGDAPDGRCRRRFRRGAIARAVPGPGRWRVTAAPYRRGWYNPDRPGEVPEWLNGAVSKTVVVRMGHRGFESHPLRLQHDRPA